MALRVDEFLSEVAKSGGIAEPTLYNIILPTINKESRGMNILCTDIEIPQRQITTKERRIGMDTVKIAYGEVLTDINLSFMLLNDFGARYYFESWQGTAYDQETKLLSYHRDIVKDVTIQVLRKGVAFDITKKKLFDSGKLPSSIASRLPRLGPLDFAQGEFDLNYLTTDDVIYEVKLIDAFPTSMASLSMGASADGLIKQTVQLSYKNFKTTSKYSQGKGSQLGQALLAGAMRKIF